MSVVCIRLLYFQGLFPIFAGSSHSNFDMDQLCGWDAIRLILSSDVHVHWPFISPIENLTEILVAGYLFCLIERRGKWLSRYDFLK